MRQRYTPDSALQASVSGQNSCDSESGALDHIESLDIAFDAVRQADAIVRLAEVMLDQREDQAIDTKTVGDFADLGHAMRVVRRLLDTALSTIDGVEFELRKASK